MPAMRRYIPGLDLVDPLQPGPENYVEAQQQDRGIPIDDLASVLPSRSPPPEVAAMAKTAPQDELRAAQRESDLLRFLSTQGRGFDEAGRIIAGIPGSMQIDLAGTEKPVEHVQQRQAEAYKVAQAEEAKRREAEAKAERARLEKKADERYAKEQETAERRAKEHNNALVAAGRGKVEAQDFAKGNELFDREQGLRKEYDSHPDVKEYRQTAGSYLRLKQAASKPSAAGDVAIIFHYMKMLDPGVSVMADDIKNARQTASIPDQLWGYFERARTGQSLSATQRADFLQQAERLYGDSKTRFDDVTRRYQEIATSAGVAPERVAPPGAAGQTQRAASGPAKGFTRVQVADDQPQVDIPNENLGAFQADYPGAKIIAKGG